MSLITRNKIGTRRAGADGGRRARQAEQARRAAEQAAPFARSAWLVTQQGVYGARVWAAPRVERTGQLVQERAAPRLAAMMSAAAHRIDPARPRGRRWPVMTIGAVMLAGGTAVAALLLGRRSSGLAAQMGRHGEDAPSREREENTSAQQAPGDVKRHAHTS